MCCAWGRPVSTRFWWVRPSCARPIQARLWRSCLRQPDMFTSDVPRLTEWAPAHWPVAADWQPLVDRFLASEAGQALAQFLTARLAGGAIIYPPQPLRAL